MQKALTATVVGTYLLVKVDHVPTRVCQGTICQRHVATYLSNFAKDSAPIVCKCSSTVAIHDKFPALEPVGNALWPLTDVAVILKTVFQI